jgi:signal transduction histidine kinase
LVPDPRQKNEHQSGAVLALGELPSYHAALVSRRVIMANDARSAAETRELATIYLIPNGITSMMDAPVYRSGEVVGVVCLEHVGPLRDWTKRECDLAASVADVVAVLLEQAARVDAEALLREQHEELAKSEKLAALMRFGGGVAHDFNNVLATILLQTNMLHGARSADEIRATADGIEQAAEVGRRIVKQLLTFCRNKPSEPRAVDLGRTLEGLRSFLASALGERHRLLVAELPPRVIVHADPAQIDQLALNLVVNAREAMPDGGDVRLALEADAEWARISVTDAGVGIEDSVLDKIFEPFFTTKGHGTGLGLSTCQSIVDQHRGRIEVKSKRGEGTTFTVWLPRSE